MCCCAIMEAAPSRKRRSRHADTPRTSFHHQPPTHAHTFHLSPSPPTHKHSYHIRCCGLKSVPEGIWECPRHRCISCGSGPSQTDANGKPRVPGAQAAHTQQLHRPPKCHHHTTTHRFSASPPLFLLPHQTQTPTPPQRCGRAAPARQPIASAACRRRLASRATRSCARSARRCSSRTSPRSRGTLSSGSRSSLPSE